MMEKKEYKSINIMYPNGKAHPIKVQYVQVTNDGKYVLSYLDFSCGNYVPSFTEIFKENDVWYKNPFHYNYDDYTFEDFNSELSDKIIEELPNIIRLRVRINDDRKKVDIPVVENQSIEEVNNFGAKEIVDKEKIEAYFVLFANGGNDTIDNKSYPLDFPFPAFSIEGHNNNEIELSRCGISNNARKEVCDNLSKNVSITISSLDPQEIDTPQEKYVIHFVSCPNFEIFNEIYKAKTLNVDYDLNGNLTVEELLNKALSCEIPMTYESEYGTVKDNGVSKVSMSK